MKSKKYKVINIIFIIALAIAILSFAYTYFFDSDYRSEIFIYSVYALLGLSIPWIIINIIIQKKEPKMIRNIFIIISIVIVLYFSFVLYSYYTDGYNSKTISYYTIEDFKDLDSDGIGENIKIKTRTIDYNLFYTYAGLRTSFYSLTDYSIYINDKEVSQFEYKNSGIAIKNYNDTPVIVVVSLSFSSQKSDEQFYYKYSNGSLNLIESNIGDYRIDYDLANESWISSYIPAFLEYSSMNDVISLAEHLNKDSTHRITLYYEDRENIIAIKNDINYYSSLRKLKSVIRDPHFYIKLERYDYQEIIISIYEYGCFNHYSLL